MFFPFNARRHTLCAMQHCQIYLQGLDSGGIISFSFSCQHLQTFPYCVDFCQSFMYADASRKLNSFSVSAFCYWTHSSSESYNSSRCALEDGLHLALLLHNGLSVSTFSVPLVFHQASSLTHHMWSSFSSRVFSVCARLYCSSYCLSHYLSNYAYLLAPRIVEYS